MSSPAPTKSVHAVPPDLKLLEGADHLFVRQCIEIAEFFYDAPNKYEILDKTGKRIYFAAETKDCCSCTPKLNISVLDVYGHEVFNIHRNGWCNTTTEVSYGSTVLGTIKDRGCWCKPTTEIRNPAGEIQLTVKGQNSTCCMCGTVIFDVRQPDGTIIGKICKEWAGLMQEWLTSADNFGISFPVILDTSLKVLLLATTIILDIELFEKEHRRNHL